MQHITHIIIDQYRLYRQGTAGRHGGFTMVETLVAITVLLLAVVAPMSLANDGIVASRLAQDQIVAFYLAQEGVEAIKNMRDHNRLTNDSAGQLGNNLGGNLANCIVSDPNDQNEEGCIIDTTRKEGVGEFWTQSCSGGCEPLRISDTSPYIYSHQPTGTSASKYIREIKVWNPGGDISEAIVEAKIVWLFARSGESKTYTVRNYLYDW
ncbi:MAG: type IV pilus modification PilV family protein [Patescibacteria group bacterium]